MVRLSRRMPPRRLDPQGRRRPPGLPGRTVTCLTCQGRRGPAGQASVPGKGGHRPPIPATGIEKFYVGATHARTKHASIPAPGLHPLSSQAARNAVRVTMASERELRSPIPGVTAVQNAAPPGTIIAEVRREREERRARVVATARVRSLGKRVRSAFNHGGVKGGISAPLLAFPRAIPRNSEPNEDHPHDFTSVAIRQAGRGSC
jgi:hypothetical protein